MISCHIFHMLCFHFAVYDGSGPLDKHRSTQDPSQKFRSMEELWGPDLAKTTLRQLLGMQFLAKAEGVVCWWM